MADAVKRLSLHNEPVPQEILQLFDGEIRNVSEGNLQNLKLELNDLMKTLEVLRVRFEKLAGFDPIQNPATCVHTPAVIR